MSEDGGQPTAFTPRGFAVYADFTDTYGARVRVQESSAAAAPRVWIFINADAATNSAAAHLSPEQARQVRDALNLWLGEGER